MKKNIIIILILFILSKNIKNNIKLNINNNLKYWIFSHQQKKIK